MKPMFISALLLSASVVVQAQSSDLKSFPKGQTPEEVGLKLSEHFVPSKRMLYGKYNLHYAEACTWYGALRFAEISKNKSLHGQLLARFERLLKDEYINIPERNHVDYNMFGCVPLQLHLMQPNEKYKQFGLSYADSQWHCPDAAHADERAWSDKGYSWQTRLWIDDMFMITIIQSKAYQVTGERKYIDRACREMVLYLDELQKPNGLFFHAPDVPYYWSRGDGWMAAGMAELLRYTPKDNPDRPRIMEGYRKMMKGLLGTQRPSGMWNQLIDDPNCWAETSGTAMFTYAMIVGAKQGWLGKEYAVAARKGWIALQSYITPEGDVREVCMGTAKKDSKEWYYNRPRIIGDYHGQAPVLWCAFALLEP